VELKGSRSKPTTVPDNFGRLWRFFEAQRQAWRATNAGFERRNFVIVDRTRWTIICKIHALKFQPTRLEKINFRASITIWPGTMTKSERFARVRVANAGRPARQWRREAEGKIRKQGYRGRWRRFPGGKFGDFWKTLRDLRAARAEVKLLDSLRLS
jgi:hypothetical protein